MTQVDKCSVDGCQRNTKGRTAICNAHYQRRRLYGDPAYPYQKRTHKADVCEADGCSRTDYGGHGYCTTHYYRYRKYGSPLAESPIKAKKGNRDGYISKQGYRIVHVLRDGEWKKTAEHRLVMEQYLKRRLLPKENVHHKNGDRCDNRIENLELWNTSQPSGQRVEDKLEWAKQIVALYAAQYDK